MRDHRALKPRVLVLVRYYLPGFRSGGPVRTIANMVEQLGDSFDFCVVTSDRDALEATPYETVTIDGWNSVGNAQVYYLSPKNLTLRRIARIISTTPHDVLYLNSFFDRAFTRLPLLARRLGLLPKRPVVIAPRGECAPDALALKRWRKTIYRFGAARVGLYRELIWQASGPHERLNIEQMLGVTARRIFVAPNLPAVLCDEMLEPAPLRLAESGPLRVVYLSRIAPMKNLDFALRVLSRVESQVVFDVYGPIDAKPYWQACLDLIAKTPPNVTVRYQGAKDHAEVFGLLSEYELFFLPTRGENFGHVIMESLSAGTPVLISDRTPWRYLESAGVGWDLALDDEWPFAKKIDEAAQMSKQAYWDWKARVRAYARAYVQQPERVAANRQLFREAAGQSALAT